MVDPANSSLDELLKRVVDAANKLSGAPISADLRDGLNAFADRNDKDVVCRGLASLLPAIRSPQGAGMVALYLGTAVEYGVNPEPAIPFLMDTLLRFSRRIGTTDEGRRANHVEDDVLAGLQSIGQGLVAHLAQSPAQREHFRTQPDVIAELERTEHLSVGVCWVAALLSKRSGKLLVLHVEQRKGCIVGYQNLANCFHLFTLLQHALVGIMPGARRPAGRVIAVASCWHYGRGDVPESNIMASVWGEESPDHIPTVGDYQVLLLWPSIFASRNWDGGFFMPYLAAAPPSVTVLSELSPVQAEEWWERLRLPSSVAVPRAKNAEIDIDSAKPWWKFW